MKLSKWLVISKLNILATTTLYEASERPANLSSFWLQWRLIGAPEIGSVRSIYQWLSARLYLQCVSIRTSSLALLWPLMISHWANNIKPWRRRLIPQQEALKTNMQSIFLIVILFCYVLLWIFITCEICASHIWSLMVELPISFVNIIYVFPSILNRYQ